MKRLLLVVLILGLSVPASAEVLVYSAKQAEVEMQSNSGVWLQLKGSYTDFYVIEPLANNTAAVLSVMTYKQKDLTGKMQNYYITQDLGTFTMLQVQVGTKQKWVISGTHAQLKITMTGDWKPGKKALGDHGNGPNCSNCHNNRPNRVAVPANATTMAGSSVWDQTTGADRSIGSAKITAKFNAAMTSQVGVNGYNTSQAVDYIVGTLTAKGFLPGN